MALPKTDNTGQEAHGTQVTKVCEEWDKKAKAPQSKTIFLMTLIT